MPGSEPSTEAHICDSCFKSYQRRDLLVRHRRRCLRSDRPPMRRKACNACVQAKTKCCYTQPTCARCAKRGIACEYVSPPPTVAPMTTADAASDLSKKSPPPRARETDVPSMWNRTSPLGDLGADSLDSWNSQNLFWGLETLSLPSLPSSEASVPQDAPLGPTSHPSFPFPSLSSASQPSYSALVEEARLAPAAGMPDGPPSRDPNSSSRASESSADVSGVRAALHVQRLLQYPRLLLRDDFYSPFLHRTLFNEQVPDMTILPHTSMAICCGSALGTPDGAAYVKRAMDAQRQSLIESYPTYHCLEQWDALHAMLLYEILEVGVAPMDTAENWKRKRPARGLKSPFLSKMTQCFSRSYLETHDAALLPDTNCSWVQWAVAETARRTIFLANMVNFVNNCDLESGRQSPYYEPLNDELIMTMPLPCSHALWSARTEEEWRQALQETQHAVPTSTPGSATGSALSVPAAHLAAGTLIAVGEPLPNPQSHASLQWLFSRFSKDYLRDFTANAGFGDSDGLRSLIILCALEQFS